MEPATSPRPRPPRAAAAPRPTGPSPPRWHWPVLASSQAGVGCQGPCPIRSWPVDGLGAAGVLGRRRGQGSESSQTQLAGFESPAPAQPNPNHPAPIMLRSWPVHRRTGVPGRLVRAMLLPRRRLPSDLVAAAPGRGDDLGPRLGALGSGRGPAVEGPETYTCGYAHSSHEPHVMRPAGAGATPRCPLTGCSVSPYLADPWPRHGP